MTGVLLPGLLDGAWGPGVEAQLAAGPGVALEACQADESRPIEALESLSSSPIICRSLWLTRPVAGSVWLDQDQVVDPRCRPIDCPPTNPLPQVPAPSNRLYPFQGAHMS